MPRFANSCFGASNNASGEHAVRSPSRPSQCVIARTTTPLAAPAYRVRVGWGRPDACDPPDAQC